VAAHHASLVSVAFAACMAASWPGHAEESSVTLQRYHHNNQLAYCFEVPRSRIARLPTWSEGKGEPPISQVQAQSVGILELRSEYPAVEKFEVVETKLRKLELREELLPKTVWYYESTFAAVRGGEREHNAAPYVAIVLLDGKAVPKERTRCGVTGRAQIGGR
jgi:hypothetical protein